MKSVLKAVMEYYWNPQEVYEGDEPLRIVVPHERFTSIALRPTVPLAKVLCIDGYVSTRGLLVMEMYLLRADSQLPLPTPGRYQERMTVDRIFESVMLKSAENPACRGVRSLHGVAKLLRNECRCDGHTEYLLCVSRCED